MNNTVELKESLSELKDVLGMLELLMYCISSPEIQDSDAILRASTGIKDLFELRLETLEKILEN